MSYAGQMLDACPRALNVDTGLLAGTLEASTIAPRHASPIPAVTWASRT